MFVRVNTAVAVALLPWLFALLSYLVRHPFAVCNVIISSRVLRDAARSTRLTNLSPLHEKS